MRITNKLGLPTPFVDAVSREYQYKPKQYSVTSLLKGICQVMLERRHADEIEQDVSEMVWMIFGTSVHSILENGQESAQQLKENKIVVDVGEYKLSGIFDLYDAETGTVTDYKTGTTWKVIFDDWDDYRKQLLMYAYMLRCIGFDCNRGEIVMMLKDHSKTKAKTDSSYPQKPVYIKKFEFSEKDFVEIEAYIKDRFTAIRLAEGLPDDELQPCTPEERWHKGDKWAVKKQGRKTALKVCDSEREAAAYIEERGLDDKHYIEFREGTDSRCVDYCTAAPFCPYYREKYGK